MRISLADLLATRPVLLADGATGTNYMSRGLGAGEPPELWNVDFPDRVKRMHQEFVDAGADIILTNTFGCSSYRLKLHKAQDRVFELAKRAAELAGEVAAAVDRPVVVAGSVGPLGELFEPLGALTPMLAIESFREQIAGLQSGGADVAWIETMSSIEEVHAAAQAAIAEGMPYTATMSFDTAGRTMMGVLPDSLPELFDPLGDQPMARGANCGVGASDILVSLLRMTDVSPDHVYISKGNCGVPQFRGAEVVYSGTPDVMEAYAALAVAAGARIVGGCCGTSPEHLAAMRRGVDLAPFEGRPTMDDIVGATGPLTNPAPANISRERGRGRRVSES